MSSRETILQKVKAAQSSLLPLPQLPKVEGGNNDIAGFQSVLEGIGGKMFFLEKDEPLAAKIGSLFPNAARVVSVIASINIYSLKEYSHIDQHSLENVDVAIVEARIGVAENGAIWLTEEDMKIRVLPFICEHLVVIVPEEAVLTTMNEAYEKIGLSNYGFGVFIAGPSKTADIEQSLVLGAHGPKSMTVLVRRK